MIDNYELIEPGHWFQSKPTGEIMKYDTKYEIRKSVSYLPNILTIIAKRK